MVRRSTFPDPSQEHLTLDCTGGCAVTPLEEWRDRKWALPSRQAPRDEQFQVAKDSRKNYLALLLLSLVPPYRKRYTWIGLQCEQLYSREGQQFRRIKRDTSI
ncbi:hypothetical protein EMCRGX_G018428 [Ephydatia muelleri]